MKTQNAFHPSAGTFIAEKNLTSDRELVEMYVDGDEKSLEILLHRHKTRIYYYILKLVRDRDHAEDVFQETFFKVVRCLKGGLYNEEDKFLPWTMRIARNMIIDHFRRAARIRMISKVRGEDGEYEDIFNVIDVGEKQPAKHIENRHAHREIRRLVKKLPFEQRQVLVMREYFNMSFQEICKMTKMNLNTALGRMRYALINLKKMAQEERLGL